MELANQLSVCEQIKELLHGADYPLDSHASYAAAVALAKEHGYYIIYGESDDIIHVDGLTRTDAGATDDSIRLLDEKGFLPILGNGRLVFSIETIAEAIALAERYSRAIKITVTRDSPSVYWSYEASIGGEDSIEGITFDVIEFGGIYCRGLILKAPERLASSLKDQPDRDQDN